VRVVVVGGQGFIGQALVARLHRGAGLIDGQPASLITVLDQHIGARLTDRRLRYVEGDIGDPAVLARALEGGADCVFHLASVPGGAAEQNFELGMRVNLHATLSLLEALRLAEEKGTGATARSVAPTLVFASSIGIYGVPMPAVIDESTIPLPTLSYGAQKLIGEYLVADYARRGFVDGRSVRIPGIVARPPSTGMLSLFLSDLIRELSAGRSFICPVAPSGLSWFMSRPCIVDNLLHAASLPAAQLAQQRTWLLPVLHVSIGDIVEAIARLHGDAVRTRVSYAPNAALQAQFASYPPLHCPRSEAAGFRHDGSVERLVTRALEPL
jgi:nucleoside-diphosphate-sugar epimerase